MKKDAQRARTHIDFRGSGKASPMLRLQGDDAIRTDDWERTLKLHIIRRVQENMLKPAAI